MITFCAMDPYILDECIVLGDEHAAAAFDAELLGCIAARHSSLVAQQRLHVCMHQTHPPSHDPTNNHNLEANIAAIKYVL